MTNFDRILTSTPLNKTAAVVARGKGVHWTPELKGGHAHYDAPKPVLPFPDPAKDLTGTTLGRLKVIGYVGTTPGSGGNSGPRWLVRCQCGRYEERRTKAIKNPANWVDRCQECHALVKIRSREYFHRTGKQLSNEDAYR